MKQKFYNWIYRSLKKMSIHSTEYIDLTTELQKVHKLGNNNGVSFSITATINKNIYKDEKIYYSIFIHSDLFPSDPVSGSCLKSCIKEYERKINILNDAKNNPIKEMHI